MKNKILLIFFTVVGLLFYINFNKKIKEIKETDFSGEKIFNNIENKNVKTSSDLQMIIYKAKNNEEIILKDDYYLTYSLMIDKPIKINLNNKNIYGKNLVNFFTINSGNVEIKNGTFFMIQTSFFAQSSNPYNVKNITLKNNSFFIEKNSNLSFNMNDLKFVENFVSVENNNKEDCSLFDYQGKEIYLLNNFFIDKSKQCKYGLMLANQRNSLIEGNIFISSLSDYLGVVSLSNSNNTKIKNNLVIDLNNENRIYSLKVFDDNGEELEEDMIEYSEGSIGFKIFNSKNIEVSNNKNIVKNILIKENSDVISDKNEIISKEFNMIMTSKLFFDCSFVKFLESNDFRKNKIFDLNNCNN
jgi:hypothetical protein